METKIILLLDQIVRSLLVNATLEETAPKVKSSSTGH